MSGIFPDSTVPPQREDSGGRSGLCGYDGKAQSCPRSGSCAHRSRASINLGGQGKGGSLQCQVRPGIHSQKPIQAHNSPGDNG